MNHEISQLQERARGALADGSEQAVLNEIAQWQSANQTVPELLHWQGLLLRALDQRSQAADLLRKAAAAAPQDAAIAHSLAQVLLEAGLPSMECFEAALILNPASSDIRLGLVSARFSEGQGQQALEELGAALANNPGWIEGHRQYAQLCALMGRPEQAFATLDRTILAFPQSLDPWLAAIALAMSGFDYAAALDYAKRAAAHHADDQQIAELRAGALDESDRLVEAASLFHKLGPANDQAGAVRRIRHHLRVRNPSAALKAAEPWLAGEHATQVWPYVALA
jgi:tetratricopeptide (TPR) repeat protein